MRQSLAGATSERIDASPSYVLRARYHDGRSALLRLDRPRTRIGTRDTEIVLTDGGVCPLHAELVFRDGLVGIRDLGSRRGTWVGGRRVDRAVLGPGRWFRIGHTTFELVEVHAVDSRRLDYGGEQTQLWSASGGLGARPDPIASAVVPTPKSPPPTIDAAVVREPPREPSRAMVPRRPAGPEGAAPLPVIVAEQDPATATWLRQALADGVPCTWVTTAAAVLAHAGAHPRIVVVLGRRLAEGTTEDLARALAKPPWSDRVVRIVAAGIGDDDPGVYYRIRGGLAPAALRQVVGSAARPRGPGLAPPSSSTHAWADRLVFEICAAASARPDAASAAAAIEAGIAQLVGCARAACIFHDGATGALWTESSDEPIEGHASGGIVGFVARTGCPVMVPVASADARYDRRVDDPAGGGAQSILAVAARSHGEVHAVLVAAREPTQGPFEPRIGEALAYLGTELGPILHRLGTAILAEGHIARMVRPAGLQLFRPEAIAAQSVTRDDGEVIRVAPTWSRTLYWALLGLLVLGVLGLAVGEISQYSTGPAVVRQRGRAEVTALGSGAIATIDVEPGQRVRRGQVLARLRDVAERTEYESARADYDAQLRNRLLDPTDEGAAGQLRLLGRQRDVAEAALEQRVIRSPHDGVVTDVGATVGQHVDAGDAVMAVVDDHESALEVVAFLPGGDRPQIEVGMPLRLELTGFDYAYQDVVVASIMEGIVGPAEAKRLLGDQLADTLPLGGGVVMVRASLPTTRFTSGDRTFGYHDGMGGTAEVRMRDQTILEVLIPGYEEL